MASATDFTLTVPRARTAAPVGVPNYELTMSVMGTQAHMVIVHGEPSLLDDAQDRLHELNAMWTRFEPTSEVSRLHAAAGEQMDNVGGAPVDHRRAVRQRADPVQISVRRVDRQDRRAGFQS